MEEMLKSHNVILRDCVQLFLLYKIIKKIVNIIGYNLGIEAIAQV